MTAASLMVFGDYTYDDLVAMADITIGELDIDGGIGPTVVAGECVPMPYPDLNWGDPYNPLSPCFDYFPIIHLTAEVEISTIGGGGQGILLVDDELEIEDMVFPEVFEFFGIIIQKGPGFEGMEFEEPGINLYGAIIAGGEVEIEDGASMRYSQCATDRALKANGLIGASVNERVWRQAMN